MEAKLRSQKVLYHWHLVIAGQTLELGMDPDDSPDPLADQAHPHGHEVPAHGMTKQQLQRLLLSRFRNTFFFVTDALYKRAMALAHSIILLHCLIFVCRTRGQCYKTNTTVMYCHFRLNYQISIYNIEFTLE